MCNDVHNRPDIEGKECRSVQNPWERIRRRWLIRNPPYCQFSGPMKRNSMKNKQAGYYLHPI